MHTLLLLAIGSLRLADNPALQAALRAGGAVLPVFLWTPHDDGQWAPGAAARWWLHHSLAALDADLRARGSRLILRSGAPAATLLEQLLSSTGTARVVWERAVTPGERAREAQFVQLLRDRGIAYANYSSRLLVDPWSIQRDPPWRVYSAYWRHARGAIALDEPGPAPRRIPAPERWPDSEPLDALGLLPGADWAGGLRATWQPGERAAQRALQLFLDQRLGGYAVHRNLPAAEGTSRLSPYLHFGELSVARVWRALDAAPHRTAANKLQAELGWREFAHYVLAHFPESVDAPLDPSYRTIAWRCDAAELRAWQRGQTGFPLVDAGLRQLWQTGWMHNRVRMAVASFLVKDLLMPWQVGARWFWDTLVDADLANNTLGWQWSAGSGFDAAPFVRVFNPTLQAQRFDPDGAYIRRFVPELRNLPARYVYRPFDAPPLVLAEASVELGTTYPYPLVDHTFSRRRALAAFAARSRAST